MGGKVFFCFFLEKKVLFQPLNGVTIKLLKFHISYFKDQKFEFQLQNLQKSITIKFLVVHLTKFKNEIKCFYQISKLFNYIVFQFL
jgi:hypothetical protein